MKVLFYVEPHPVRDVFVHFRAVARKIIPLLAGAGLVDARLFANAKTMAELPADVLKPHEKKLIRSTPEEEAFFASMMLDWNTEGMPKWEELMAGSGVALKYVQILRRIYKVFPFDVVIHWGENGAISLFQQERPFTRIGMELGCTRPPFMNSLVMDLYGTNGAALIPKLTAEDIRNAVNGRAMSTQEAVFAFSENIEAVPHEASFYPLDKSISGEIFAAQKCAFLPLQLYDDANLLRFSKYTTVADVVLDVVPKLAAHGYKVIIKPHPASKHRSNAILANSMARSALKPWADHVIWCDRADVNYNNVQLIQLSDFTVTVNSSVGFEALYFDKPVVVLGDAVYKPKDLFPTLDEMLDGRFDSSSYLKNIAYLRQFMLGAYLQPEGVMNDPSAFHRLLISLHSVYSDLSHDFAGVACRLYQANNAFLQRSARYKAFAGLSVAGANEFSTPTPALAEKKQPVAEAAQHAARAYSAVARKLVIQSGCSDFPGFEAWLNDKFSSPTGRWEVAIYGELVDANHYAEAIAHLAPEAESDGDLVDADPVEHYLEVGIHKGLAPQAALQVHSHEELLTKIVEAAHKLLPKRGAVQNAAGTGERDPREAALAAIEQAVASSTAKTCVVAHMYYVDLVPETLEALKNITAPYDLFVTLPNWGGRKIRELVQAAHPHAVFYECDNFGRDIGAFVDLLPLVLRKKYDVLLKIQTKRGYFKDGKMAAAMGEHWRKEAYKALLGSKAKVDSIVEAFAHEPALNMVGPKPYCVSIAQYPYHDGGEFANFVLDGATRSNDAVTFFAGTMFWVRPACLEALIGRAGLISVDFGQESGANDGALAHLVERIFGELAAANGGQVATVTDDVDDVGLYAATPLAISIDEHIRKSMAAAAALANGGHKHGALIW